MFLTGHPLDEYKWTFKFYTNISCERLARSNEYDKIKNCDLRFAGFISDAQERTQKNGKKFGQITIEDYSGSFTFRTFGNDYQNLKNFFEKGLFVFCHGLVQKRPWGETEELEFKVTDMELLDEVLNKRTRNITLCISLKSLSTDFVEKLRDTAQKNKGKIPLYARIESPSLNISLGMRSPTLLVNPTKFLKAIEKFSEIASIEVNQQYH